MAYLTIARFRAESSLLLETYRRTAAVMDEVGRDHGLILHAGAQTEDGLLVVNVWPSQDGSEAAAADPRRQAALREAGGVADRVTKEHYSLERCVVCA